MVNMFFLSTEETRAGASQSEAECTEESTEARRGRILLPTDRSE